jgi:hypothetical protein
LDPPKKVLTYQIFKKKQEGWEIRYLAQPNFRAYVRIYIYKFCEGVLEKEKKIYRRDTENAEVAEQNENIKRKFLLFLCDLCVLCVSAVNF